MSDKTIAQLTAGLATDVLSGWVMEGQNVGGVAPESRSYVLAEFLKIVQVRVGRVTMHSETPKVGTTSGWVVAAANNLGKIATIPASQTSSTLVLPLSGFKVGDIITAFSLVGSIQSAGNAGTITADLRSLTAAAAGATDASVGSMSAPLSVVTNTIVSAANAAKTGLTHTVAAGESFYLLITSTTGSSVTEELQGALVTVTEN